MRSCLVVDDSSVIRKVASRIVATLGFAAEGVATPDEGAEILGAGLPQLVLVSMVSGDTSVEDFVRRLRALPGGADVAVFAMLIDANLGQMTRLKRAGVNDFVFKPFNRKTLTARLNGLTQDRQAA